jgi:hypothetical protein
VKITIHPATPELSQSDTTVTNQLEAGPETISNLGRKKAAMLGGSKKGGKTKRELMDGRKREKQKKLCQHRDSPGEAESNRACTRGNSLIHYIDAPLGGSAPSPEVVCA